MCRLEFADLHRVGLHEFDDCGILPDDNAAVAQLVERSFRKA